MEARTHWVRLSRTALCLAILLVGCNPPTIYRVAPPKGEPPTHGWTEADPQMAFGRPAPFVDALGHYVFSLPTKLILWNWRACNHRISPETAAVMAECLRVNQLAKVKVRFNQYSPGGEWRRLVQNSDVAPGYRYSVGVLMWLLYTALPDRLFAGLIMTDYYNPFTNTLNIYSDLPVVVLHEGGHAKDFGQVTLKGTYAIARILIPFELWQEYVASEDAISWCLATNDREMERSAYRLLYPAFGTYVGGSIFPIAGGLIGAIPGHIVGRIRASKVPPQTTPPRPTPVTQ